MKTNELTGIALDWAVAKCEGHETLMSRGKLETLFTENGWTPSTDWAQGGPIIEREAIQLTPDEYTGTWAAYMTNEGEPYESTGTTALIAAMRCYIAAKLGDLVEIPQGL